MCWYTGDLIPRVCDLVRLLDSRLEGYEVWAFLDYGIGLAATNS